MKRNIQKFRKKSHLSSHRRRRTQDQACQFLPYFWYKIKRWTFGELVCGMLKGNVGWAMSSQIKIKIRRIIGNLRIKTFFLFNPTIIKIKVCDTSKVWRVIGWLKAKSRWLIKCLMFLQWMEDIRIPFLSHLIFLGFEINICWPSLNCHSL